MFICHIKKCFKHLFSSWLPSVNDVTVDTVENFIPHWKDRYLAANVYFKDINNNKTVPIGLVICSLLTQTQKLNAIQLAPNLPILKESLALGFWRTGSYLTFKRMEIDLSYEV